MVWAESDMLPAYKLNFKNSKKYTNSKHNFGNYHQNENMFEISIDMLLFWCYTFIIPQKRSDFVKGRVYIAIDLKSFYASVECVERGLDPLTARLVVADASRTEKTICLAVSPALKAYGIPGRARLFEVNQKVAEIKRRTGKEIDYITALPQMKRYMQVSADIYSIYLRYIAPEDIHVYSVDEVFIDYTGYVDIYKMSAHQFAIKVIQEILSKTGITATAGIGTNLYLAKIAMDIYAKNFPADKDGVRIAELDELTYRKNMWTHTPITDFWQIGKGTAKRLSSIYVHTMGDLARQSLCNEELLYRMFGINAELLIDHAWGIEPTLMRDIKSYVPSVSSLSSGQVLSQPYSCENARIIVFEMADKLSLDLVRKQLVTEGITLDLGYDIENIKKGFKGKIHIDRYGRAVPEHTHVSCRFREPTNSSRQIINSALELFDKSADTSLTVRRLTICANNVVSENSVSRQLTLFSDSERDIREKSLKLMELSIKSRFGKNAVLRGINFVEGATMRERNEQVGGHKA